MQPEWDASGETYPVAAPTPPATATPQPPLPPPPVPGAPPGSLGDVTAQANAVTPTRDYRQLYEQNLALTTQAHSSSLRPELDEASVRPGRLANILTGGMLGLAAGDYTRGYNARVQRDNALVRKQMSEDALQLTGYAALADRADLQQQMAMLRLQWQAGQAQLGNMYKDFDAWVKKMRLEAGGSSKPPTLPETQLGNATGWVFRPDPPGMPGSKGGRWVFQGKPGTEGSGPPNGGAAPPGFGGGKPGDPAAATKPGGPRDISRLPDTALTPEEARRRERGEKADETFNNELAQGRAKRKVAREAAGPIKQQIQAAIDATDILPSGAKIGDLFKSVTGTTGLMNKIRAMRPGQEKAYMDKLRILRSGSLLTQPMYRMVAPGVATEQDVAEFKRRLEGLDGMTAAEAKNYLLEIQQYVNDRTADITDDGGYLSEQRGAGAAPGAAAPSGPAAGGTMSTGGSLKTSDQYLQKFQTK